MRPCFMNEDLFDFLIVYVVDQSVFSVIISCFEMSMTMEKQWQNASATAGSSLTIVTFLQHYRRKALFSKSL